MLRPFIFHDGTVFDADLPDQAMIKVFRNGVNDVYQQIILKFGMDKNSEAETLVYVSSQFMKEFEGTARKNVVERYLHAIYPWLFTYGRRYATREQIFEGFEKRT